MVNRWIIYTTLHLKKIQCCLWVCLYWGAVCTLHFIVTMSFWSIRDFLWTLTINIECWKWFIWSETILESIVGIRFCCHWHMSFVQTGLPIVVWFRSISDFLDSRALEYYVYCIWMVNWWIMHTTLHLRKIQCRLCVFVLRSCLHLAFHSHKVVQIHLWFFLVSSAYYRVFEMVYLERDCFGVHSRYPLLLSLTHVIRAHCGYPNGRVLTRSPIFLLHALLTTMKTTNDSSVGEICQRRLVLRRVDCWGMSI